MTSQRYLWSPGAQAAASGFGKIKGVNADVE